MLQHVFLKKQNATLEWFSKTFQEIPNLQEKIGKLPDEYSFTYMEITTNGEKDLVIAPAEFDFKPDSNSLLYVSSLLQALNTLGSLKEFLENIEQRIASELFLIVEDEIKKASEKLKKSQISRCEVNEKFVLVPTGMNNVSRDEFYLFCPILRETSNVIIVKLLVIVNIFKFISENVQNLNNTNNNQSSSVDNLNNKETPLSLAVQAAFREVKNFVTRIIYSHSSPSEIFMNPLSDISEILKNSKSKSTNDNGDLFTFSMTAEEDCVSEIRSMAIKVNERERYLSKKIASALNIDPYTSSKNDLGHKQFVKPNIQYLQVLYKQIVTLYDIFKDLLPTDHELSSNQNIMAGFESILEKEYIPFVENYMIHELVSAFKGSDSSNWVDFSDSSDSITFNSTIGKKSDSILCSYLTFVRLICEACRLIYFIPSHQDSFERIMEQLCDQLLDKSEVTLRDLILVKYSGEEDSASNLLCFSVQFAKNPEIREILGQNSLLQAAATTNVQLNRLLSEKEAILMERLKGDRSIGKNELIFDPKVIRELALLQRSFEKVQELIFSGRYNANISRSMTRIVADESKNLHLHVYEEGKKTIFKLGNAFDAKFVIFSELLDKLAQTCLFTLHCEIRTHTFYFLDLAYREGSYKLDSFGTFNSCVNEPDPYVLSWTGDLLNLSDSLSDWFPLTKYLFLFDGLAVLIDSILVNNFQYIKRINEGGLRKLCTNTTAIIQILTQILPPSEVSFPKSTEYYRLAQISSDKLMSEIEASGIKFTFSQYRALLDLVYRERTGDEEARKAFLNQITMLKYIKSDTEKDKEGI